MKITDKKVSKINDDRLMNYTQRTRSGNVQVFYTGNDSRDFERYRAEGGNQGRSVKIQDKPDTTRITPPEIHYYAELIDSDWWWVNGCAECNGNPRDWMTYVECVKHDVCRSCKTPRKDVEQAWGGKHGWQCETCNDAQREEEKKQALEAMPDDEDFDSSDYEDLHEITCPYCAYEFSDSFESSGDDEAERDCPRCDNEFIVTAVHSLSFDCIRKEKP